MSGVYKPSELFPFLKEIGVYAKKSLSQNFLIDGNILTKIVGSAQVTAEDTIIEIGPGPGALTQSLLKTGAKVIAIEKDRAFAKALSRLQTLDCRLQIIEGDFLDFPLEDFLKNNLKPNQRAKVVANLPYHLTSPIIARLIPLHHVISSLTLMVQKEVAMRFVAKKNSPDYSSFTLFLEYFSLSKYCFSIEPSCFYPKPKVRSAVVHLTLISPKIRVPSDFFKMVRTAFQKRRKMLRSSLKELYGSEKIENSLEKLGLNTQSRPESLSLQEFISFFRQIDPFQPV